MRLVTHSMLLIAGAMLVAGCGVYATYEYTIEVRNDRPDTVPTSRPSSAKESDSAALVHVTAPDGVHDVSLSEANAAATIRFQERLAPPLMPIVRCPRGDLTITVTKAGYQPWKAGYGTYDFVKSDDVYRRIDVVLLRSVGSKSTSALTPIRKYPSTSATTNP